MKNAYSPEEFAELAISALMKNANEKIALDSQRYFKEPVDLLGISTPEFRKISKELYGLIKGSWSEEEAFQLGEILISNNYLEIKGLSLMILEKYVHLLKREKIFRMKQWIENNYFDNWALIDGLCLYVLWKMVENYEDLIPEIVGWTGSPNLWVRRAVAVSFVKHARKGKYLDTVYLIAERLFPGKEDLIHKANGWLLREAGKTDMDRLEKFLLDRGLEIPRTTVRYAIERFKPDKRKELLNNTKI